MCLQFRDKDVTQDIVKCFAQVQVDGICCSFLIHHCSNFIIEGYQICQTQFAFNEAVLAVTNYLIIKVVYC